MFEDDVTVPAGWYPDPMGLPQLRWWNNHAWTELTTEARPPLVMQVPTRLAYADEELPTRRQQREQRERDEQYANLATDEDDARDAAAAHAPLTVTLREIDAPVSAADPVPRDEPDGLDDLDDEDEAVDPGDRDPLAVDPRAANLDTIDYDSISSGLTGGGALDPGSPVQEDHGAPASFESLFQPRAATSSVAGSTAQNQRTPAAPNPHPESPLPGRSPGRLPIYSAPVWIIALVPLLLLVLSLLLLLGFGASLNMWVVPGIWLSSYLLVVILAIADRIILGKAGYEHRASWAWALLTAPVYLIARSMSLAKVGPLGFAPVLVWAALGILQVGSVLVVPGLIISALPNVFTAQAEQSIASDASIIGADISVNCAKTLPVIIGQTFTCAATSATKSPFEVTVSLQRTNGWIDWHVDDWGIYSLSR
ncbi:MAG: DUF2510 domain-containing protein [Actinomycetota bacterium]